VASNPDKEMGLIELIYRRKNAQTAFLAWIISLIVFFVADSLWLHNLPSGLRSILELSRDSSVHVFVLLSIFLVTYLFYQEDKEILSQREVRSIGNTIADRVQSLIASPRLDGTLLQRQENSDMLDRAKIEVWLSRETGNSLLRGCRDQLYKLLATGCKFKIVLTQPKSTAASQTSLRNTNSNKRNFDERFEDSRIQLESLFYGHGESQRLVEVRYSPVCLSSTMTISNPDTKAGYCEILYSLIPHLARRAEQRMSVRVTSMDSPLVTDAMKKEFRRTFRHSSKLVMPPLGYDLGKIGLERMLPNFFGSNTPVTTAMTVAGEYRLIPHADEVFVMLFDVEAADQADYFVRFGAGNGQAIKERYATALPDGKWKVSIDNLMKLRDAFDEAVRARKVILIANLGDIALGLSSACEKTELSKFDASGMPQANQDFFERHRTPGTDKMPMSVVAGIEELIDDLRSHAFIHFQDGTMVGASRLYTSLAGSLRTSLLDEEPLARHFGEELEASVTVTMQSRLLRDSDQGRDAA
jgi:hypothetical protein